MTTSFASTARDEQAGATPAAGLRAFVVPLDGSSFAERAVSAARHFALRLGATVHLLGVTSSAPEAEARMAELRSLAGDGVSWEVTTDDDVAATIEAARSRQAPALVCMATHGRGRSAAFLGSVAAAVLRGSHMPIVLVGPKAGVDALGTRLVACVDGTLESESVLPVAVAWAGALGLTTSVVTVAEPVPESIRHLGHYDRMHGPEVDADAYMADLVSRWRATGVPIEGTAVYDPVRVAGGVRRLLTDEHAALVVLGTRARSGLARFVLGSVAAAVVHESPVPVLVVPIERQKS
jgi:nucleotide-binding universal stress UspA family protein